VREAGDGYRSSGADSPSGAFVLGSGSNASYLLSISCLLFPIYRLASREYIESRAKLFSREDFERALKEVPDVEPEEHDRFVARLVALWAMRDGSPGDDGTPGNQESATYRLPRRPECSNPTLTAILLIDTA
jgi:hypothetical protein